MSATDDAGRPQGSCRIVRRTVAAARFCSVSDEPSGRVSHRAGRRTSAGLQPKLQRMRGDRISPTQKIVLITEILLTYSRARRALSRSSLPTALSELRGARDHFGGEFSAADHLTGRRLGRAVRRTLALVPARSNCLMQSLTLTAMLAHRDIESSLVIGVRSDEEFGAHAWVEYQGRPLLPTFRRRFERLVEV